MDYEKWIAAVDAILEDVCLKAAVRVYTHNDFGDAYNHYYWVGCHTAGQSPQGAVDLLTLLTGFDNVLNLQ